MCMPIRISINTEGFAAQDAERPTNTNVQYWEKAREKRKMLQSVGLACQGLGLPEGFSLGLILEGVFADSILTWRFSFYLNLRVNALLLLDGWRSLPKKSCAPSFTVHDEAEDRLD
ncbi:hypothetical protein ETB97_000933 [Aspergillus alliaceus]|uniref:Uncharacterized protein n=1 Tax=Petromyces alliaceus TaxID=209559 RepID=A0A8H6E645_PETAA|nr:hypothetical protein ETB97_000933 [Aspergillus burnettii]